MRPAALLKAENVCKSFGEVRALDDVSLTVAAGEVHGLLGANGAGKSTLIGVLSGAVRPDSGRLSVAGRDVPLGSLAGGPPSGARRRPPGADAVPRPLGGREHFCERAADRAPRLRQPPRLPAQGRGRAGYASALLSTLGKPRRRPTASPSAARRNRSCPCAGGTVLVLDEPTSALSQPEAQGLFDAIRGIVAQEAAVIFVSHRLDEVFAITDRLTVLRDGRVEGRWRTAEADIPIITRAMVGQLADEQPRPAGKLRHRAVAISLRGLARGISDLALSINAGEVVGLAGLEGSGTSTVLQMLTGIVPVVGRIEVDGRAVAFRHPSQAIGEGLVYMPADRKKDGLWLERDATFNIGAALVAAMRSLKWLRRDVLERAASARMSQVAVRMTASREAVGRFSGGNQQRVLLGRCLEARPRVLLLNDFTRGVDVKAKASIHRLVRELADEGLAICVTSSDLEELLGVADRIICMRGGRIVADRPSADFDMLSLLALASTAPHSLGAQVAKDL